jgi:plastocyanin
MSATRLRKQVLTAAAGAIAAIAVAGGACARSAPLPPVYVHMNGANEFLENVVAVRPGQPVVFVDQDTGPHTVVGYNPATGATSKRFDGAVEGTPGPGHPVHTYTIRFRHAGLKFYYCSIHAELAHEPGGVTSPKKRPTVHGFGDPMDGLIIVTTDAHLLASNPATSRQRILPHYFGG